MPSYPCESCGNLIEISGLDFDVPCKKCNEKKPFKCSKCQRRISVSSIYHPERLTFRKPLFCTECGAEADFVKCNQCGTTIMRSNAKQVVYDKKPHYYHHKCYDDAIKMRNKVFPWSFILLSIVFFYFCYMLYPTWWMLIPGFAIGFFASGKIAAHFGPK